LREVNVTEEVAAGEGLVLYVGNVPGSSERFVEVMREHGFRNEVVACDGEECLDYLFGEGSYDGRDTGVAPRLILLELGTAHSDGFETLRRIREDERTSLLPVVMFSATSLPGDVAVAYRLGTNAFVDRSLVPVAFPELVRQVARFWLHVNEPPPASRARAVITRPIA
jgi:CheY-like chemotaxis protein